VGFFIFLLFFFQGSICSSIFSMDRFVMVYLIFNKGLREETEHRLRQDSLDVPS